MSAPTTTDRPSGPDDSTAQASIDCTLAVHPATHDFTSGDSLGDLARNHDAALPEAEPDEADLRAFNRRGFDRGPGQVALRLLPQLVQVVGAEVLLVRPLLQQRDQLLELKLRKQTGQVENTSELTHRRRDIARMETIRNEKVMAEKASV